MKWCWWARLSIGLVSTWAGAQFLAPGSDLVVDGIPPISTDLVARVQPYLEFTPTTLLAWHPAKPGMLVRKRTTKSSHLHYVASPGAIPERVKDLPDDADGALFQPKTGRHILFYRAADDKDERQILQMDFSTKAITSITGAKARAGNVTWNRTGDRVIYTTAADDRKEPARKTVTTLYLADPFKPHAARTLASIAGGHVDQLRISPDDKWLVYRECISPGEAQLWSIDMTSGDKRRVTPAPAPGTPVNYSSPRIAADGMALYALSDRNSEFRQLVRIDLATEKETALTARFKHDVDEFAISEKANRIALVMNEEGVSVLRLLELTTLQELPRPALLPGEISGLRWSGGDGDEGGDGRELAMNISSARSPGDVYSLDLASKKITRWTNSASPALNPLDFVEPKLIRWTSVDGVGNSGFLYQPDRLKFSGRRPVIINICGGPESQARAGFINRSNYVVNELGVAIIFTNTRGSAGFGKKFAATDEGGEREHAIKDVGALLDWIGKQPDLDAGRILIQGGNYGAYSGLAASARYADRIAGAMFEAGIANYVTLQTNGAGYERDLQYPACGDEHNPDMRISNARISSRQLAEEIRKPLFIAHGGNDSHVPYKGAEQIVALLKKQKTAVWFVKSNDKHHSFAKESNAEFLFYAQVKFLEEILLQR